MFIIHWQYCLEISGTSFQIMATIQRISSLWRVSIFLQKAIQVLHILGPGIEQQERHTLEVECWRSRWKVIWEGS